MDQVTLLLKLSFIAVTLLTVWQFYRATNKSTAFLIVIVAWMALQFFVVQTGFYQKADAVPPRLMFQLMPAVIVILILFLTRSGRLFIDGLNTGQLTMIHAIRIPVEIILYYLFAAKVIPQIMTFEGRNFDILAGLTAPFIFYFGYKKSSLSNKFLLIWNLLSLGLLLNILSIAILSAKSPFQQFAFYETNIALGYFPFNWLPSVVVPLVLLSHLVTIKQLVIKGK